MSGHREVVSKINIVSVMCTNATVFLCTLKTSVAGPNSLHLTLFSKKGEEGSLVLRKARKEALFPSLQGRVVA
jgi:hypothetical protein